MSVINHLLHYFLLASVQSLSETQAEMGVAYARIMVQLPFYYVFVTLSSTSSISLHHIRLMPPIKTLAAFFASCYNYVSFVMVAFMMTLTNC